jgi:hypothetical protein
MTPAKRSLLHALVISVAFAAIISYALMARVENIDDTPMSGSIGSSQISRIPLLETGGPPSPIYVIWLRPDRLPDLLRYPEVRIHILATDDGVHLTTATLEVLGTECAYRTSSGANLNSASLIRFHQTSKCSPLVGSPTGSLKLTVAIAERNRISLAAFTPAAPETQSPGVIRVVGAPDAGNETSAALRGYYVQHLTPSSTRRIDLLAYMWQHQSATWMWGLLGIACVLFLVSAGVILSIHVPSDSGHWRVALRTSLGFGCGAAALALMYAVIVPPLQAPDEPDHLLSHGRLVDDRQLESRLRTWAQLVHFNRIVFQGDERFRPVDMGRPFPLAWRSDMISGEDVRARSMTATAWWSWLARLMPQTSVSRQLMFLRFANVLLFALCVAAAAGVLVLGVDSRMPRADLLAAVFLLIPTLPFFAMHVSEYSLLISLYVVFAACTLVMFLGGPMASWIGAPLGLSMALLMASGRGALPMAPLMASLLCLRVLLGETSSDAADARRRSLRFWMGLGLTLCAGTWLFPSQYVSFAIDPVPAAGRSLFSVLSSRWLPLLVAALAATGWLAELAVGTLRRCVPPAVNRVVAATARWSARALAAAIITSLAWSLVADVPQLEFIDADYRPDQQTYVLDVLKVSAYWARASQPDFLLSSSFWGGFGWLDAMPGLWLINTMTVATALMLVVLLAGIARRRDARQFAALMILAAGITATIAAYAFATHGMQRNLHGRYLVGVYLTGLAVAFSPIAMSSPEALKKIPIPRAGLALAAMAVIHAYCLRSILLRYF